MPEAAHAVPNPAEAKGANRITELKVSGHLMMLDAGLFCVFHAPGQTVATDRSGLPGVRISVPPNAGEGREVTISTFRPDGWLNSSDDAALVRVVGGPAQILVTIYQSAAHRPETAPRLQVLRLSAENPAGAAASPLQPAPAVASVPPVAGRAAASGAAQAAVPGNASGSAGSGAAASGLPDSADMVAHVQRMGDVAVRLGEWIGKVGSGTWIEGFGISPHAMIEPADIEYQAVLGRGWLSPWVDGGKFCGSRGMSLPLLGLRLRLRGKAAEAFDCTYTASFVDGTKIGPLSAGETCEAESLSPLEAFQVTVTPKAEAGVAAPAAVAPSASRRR